MSCSPKELFDQLQKEWDKFTESVYTAWQELSFKALGDSLVGALATLGQFFGVLLAAIIGAAISQSIQSLAGMVNALTGFLLNSVQGLAILLRYFAAKTLTLGLTARIIITQKLLHDTRALISLLNSLLSKSLQQQPANNLSNAVVALKKAELIIGRELTKQEADAAIPPDGVQTAAAIKQLDVAIDVISFSATSKLHQIANALTALNTRYGLQTRFEVASNGLPKFSVIDPQFKKFWEGLKLELESNLGFFANGKPTPRFYQYLSELLTLAGLPDLVKMLILRQQVEPYTKTLSRGLPIPATAAVNLLVKEIPGLSKSLLKEDSKLDNSADFLSPIGPNPETEYEDGETLLLRNTAVVVQETIILALPTWIVKFKGLYSGSKQLFSEVLQRINAVRVDIEDNINMPPKMSLKRLEWVYELSKVKLSLSSTVDATGQLLGNSGISAASIQRQFTEALVTYDNLQQFIINKSFDPTSGVAKTLKADLAMRIATKRLNSLAIGPQIVLNKTLTKATVAALQALRVALEEMLAEDSAELQITTNFTTQVEQVPIFGKILLPSWNAMMEQLNFPLQSNLLGISKGDISSLVGIGISAGTLVESIIQCLFPKAETAELPAYFNELGGVRLDAEGLQSWYQKTKKTSQDLQNRMKILNTLEAQLPPVPL